MCHKCPTFADAFVHEVEKKADAVTGVQDLGPKGPSVLKRGQSQHGKRTSGHFVPFGPKKNVHGNNTPNLYVRWCKKCVRLRETYGSLGAE